MEKLTETSAINPRGLDILARLAARVPKDSCLVLAAFAIPLVLRAVPEIIMGPYVVGFDTLAYYVPTVLKVSSNEMSFVSFMATAPLLYVLLSGLVVLGVSVVVAIKVLSPVLYGFLGLSVFFFAHKGLEWSRARSLVVVLLATGYFVTLRISWDMLRNELGLIFLFLALTLLLRSKNRFRDYLGLSVVMVLIVLSNQYVSVLLFSLVLGAVILKLRRRLPECARNIALYALPSGLLFLPILYLNVSSAQNSWVSNVNHPGWYSLFTFSSPYAVLSGTIGFLLFCYLPLLPLVFLGTKVMRNVQLNTWIVASLLLVAVAAAVPLFNPTAYRWILMLVFPLSFFAAEGLLRVQRKRYQIASVFVLASLALSFVCLPGQYAFPYYTAYLNYVPSSMLSNTVSLIDSPDTSNVLGWAREHIEGGSGLLVHDAFHGWAVLSFNQDQLISYGYAKPDSVAQEAIRNGYSRLYLIWWIDGRGWHGQKEVAICFKEVFHSGTIALFEYAP